MSPLEISVNGDEVWGHVIIDGERYGRGTIVKERLNEDDALLCVSLIRKSMENFRVA